MAEIPVRPSNPEKYKFTEMDKKYLASFAVNGVIPFDSYIKAFNDILNRREDYKRFISEVLNEKL